MTSSIIEPVVALIYGVLIGNALTTAFFRIPRNIPINGWSAGGGKKPHCSHCGHLLLFWEYLPVFSWICTRWSCRYCGSRTDLAYPALEISTMLASLLLFMALGLNERMAFALLMAASILLSLMLWLRHRRMFLKSWLIMVLCGMINLLYWCV